MTITIKDAHEAIDSKAGAVRACYITIAPGQEATYMLKAQDANEYRDAGYAGAVPPLVAAEAYAVGETPQQATDRILAEQEQWRQLAAIIESVRRSGKIAVAAATDADRPVVLNAIILQLAGMMR